MKKIIILTLTVFILGIFITGCGKNSTTSANTNKSSTKTISRVEVTKDDVKKMNDQKLIDTISKGESDTTLDNIDVNISSDDLDAIVNQNDPIADIPTN